MAGNEVTSGLWVSLFWILLSGLTFLSLLHSFLAFSPGMLDVPGIKWRLSIGTCQTRGEVSSLLSSPVCSYVSPSLLLLRTMIPQQPVDFRPMYPHSRSQPWGHFWFPGSTATYMPFLGDWGAPNCFLHPTLVRLGSRRLPSLLSTRQSHSPLSLACSMA